MGLRETPGTVGTGCKRHRSGEERGACMWQGCIRGRGRRGAVMIWGVLAHHWGICGLPPRFGDSNLGFDAMLAAVILSKFFLCASISSSVKWEQSQSTRQWEVLEHSLAFRSGSVTVTHSCCGAVGVAWGEWQRREGHLQWIWGSFRVCSRCLGAAGRERGRHCDYCSSSGTFPGVVKECHSLCDLGQIA